MLMKANYNCSSQLTKRGLVISKLKVNNKQWLRKGQERSITASPKKVLQRQAIEEISEKTLVKLPPTLRSICLILDAASTHKITVIVQDKHVKQHVIHDSYNFFPFPALSLLSIVTAPEVSLAVLCIGVYSVYLSCFRRPVSKPFESPLLKTGIFSLPVKQLLNIKQMNKHIPVLTSVDHWP